MSCCPRSRVATRAALGALVLWALPALAWTATAPPGSPPGKGRYLQRSKGQFWGLIGAFDGDDNPGRLENEGSSLAYGFGFGYRIRPNLSLDMEILATSARYDNLFLSAPFFGSVSGRMDLESESLLLSARGIYPLRRFEPFLGGGIGLTRSELSVSGSLLGVPGVERESDLSVVFHLSVGAEFLLGERVNLGMEYRRIQTEADFDDLSNGGVDIGGRVVALTLKFFAP